MLGSGASAYLISFSKGLDIAALLLKLASSETEPLTTI